MQPIWPYGHGTRAHVLMYTCTHVHVHMSLPIRVDGMGLYALTLTRYRSNPNPNPNPPQAIADANLRALRRSLPVACRTVNYLSGAQGLVRV